MAPIFISIRSGSLPPDIISQVVSLALSWAKLRVARQSRCLAIAYDAVIKAREIFFVGDASLLILTPKHYGIIGDELTTSTGTLFAPSNGDDVIHTEQSTGDFSLEQQINKASHMVWGIPSLRRWQQIALMKLLFDSSCRRKMVLIDRTGGGKSHVMRMLGTMVGGIWLIIIPLLSLTADTMA